MIVFSLELCNFVIYSYYALFPVKSTSPTGSVIRSEILSSSLVPRIRAVPFLNAIFTATLKSNPAVVAMPSVIFCFYPMSSRVPLTLTSSILTSRGIFCSPRGPMNNRSVPLRYPALSILRHMRSYWIPFLIASL